MPASVKRAKHIRYNMTDRADIGDGEDAEAIASEAMLSSVDDECELDGSKNRNKLTAPPSSLEPDSTVALSPLPPSVFNEITEVVPPVPLSDTTPSTTELDTPERAPRPLVRSRRQTQPDVFSHGGNDMMQFMKTIMLQDQQRREEDSSRRQEEQKMAERRHERFMDMMMMIGTNTKKKRTSFLDSENDEDQI